MGEWEFPEVLEFKSYGLTQLDDNHFECPECNRRVFFKSTHCKYCSRKLKPTAIALKLKKRIEAIEGFRWTVFPYIFRTRSGYWQKSIGAYSWTMKLSDRTTHYFGDTIGCCETAKDVAKAKKIGVTGNNVQLDGYEVYIIEE